MAGKSQTDSKLKNNALLPWVTGPIRMLFQVFENRNVKSPAILRLRGVRKYKWLVY